MSLRDQNVALAKKSASLTTVGDALALARVAEQEAGRAIEGLHKATGPEYVDAMQMLNAGIADVARYRQPLMGDSDDAALGASWPDLRKAIGRLYALLWAVEEQLPENARSSAWQAWANLVVDIGKAVPEAAADTIDYAGDLASKAAGAGAAAASKILAEFVKGAWPILLGAAVLLGAGIFIAVKSGAAVPTKVKVSA